jgi:hypothetical protein
MAALAKCNHCGLERGQDLQTFDLGEQFVPAGIPNPIFRWRHGVASFNNLEGPSRPMHFNHKRNMRQLLITACFNRRNRRLVEARESRR